MNKNHTILLTGGAGYIGSHIAHLLLQEGYRIIILDTNNNALLRMQKSRAFFNSANIQFIHGNCGEAALLTTLFSKK